MFTAALIIIAETWKQPISLSVGEWVNKLWYSQTMEYYSTLKKKMSYQAMKRNGGNLNAYY